MNLNMLAQPMQEFTPSAGHEDSLFSAAFCDANLVDRATDAGNAVR